ncbi:lipase family protein [Thioalkalivibrio paradoxus]|uniref:Fungal lipase-type domain-containing protein n=1 Tax=Thioalkalivibrio paradoxus ARh 1 TaxID=713585 RepID=W0DNQ5_9GAMM|nr:lipase class 3 [Thioalkalivibrio paradoxus]AHF00092.1 hypothetical protein THITH_09230 [Thioalkalivibrio paradoxus ARh 1]
MKPMIRMDDAGTAGRVGMTLATIAYKPLDRVADALANPDLATQGRWALEWRVWGDGCQMFVARDDLTGQIAISIRGSAASPQTEEFWIDWFEQDLNTLGLSPWLYGDGPRGAYVSWGSLDGLTSLLSLVDERTTPETTLVEYLAAQQPFPGVVPVVGHGVGGTLAYMLAGYLQQHIGDRSLQFWPVTFGAPTAGNPAFAKWMEDEFAASAGRFYNTIDLVPHAWQTFARIEDSFPGAPKLPAGLRPLVVAMRELLTVLGDRYLQPGQGIALEGRVRNRDSWFDEAGLQHAPATYLQLLGAPPVP